MTRFWSASLMACVLAATASPSRAQPLKTTPLDGFLCDKFKALEQGAQHNFIVTVGQERKFLGHVALGPRTFDTPIRLPEAEDCYVQAPANAPVSYYCYWRSADPSDAALTYARRITECFAGTTVAQSDFNSNFVVTTQSGIAFFIGSAKISGDYKVRLQVDSVKR